MPIDTSMYQNFRGGLGLSSLAQGVGQGLDIANQFKSNQRQAEQAARQAEQFQLEKDAALMKRRNDLYEQLAPMSADILAMKDPAMRDQAYAERRNQLIQSGLAAPNELPEKFGMAEPILTFHNARLQKASAEKQAQADLERRFKEAQIGNLRAKSQNAQGEGYKPDARLTEAEKVIDREFGKEYSDWTSGGADMARSEIEKLRGVAAKLNDSKVTTGGLTGFFPDRMTDDSVLSARADVNSTVMNSLRAILGAQFTEKEGERIIRNTWNEADTTANNLARIERLVADLESKAKAKDAKAQYFEQRGSLSGFKGPQAGIVQRQNQSPPQAPQQGGGFFAPPAANAAPRGTPAPRLKTNQIEWAD